jgi:Na+-transporting NADH:ubiquinone oxidoreductase subunit NqrD
MWHDQLVALETRVSNIAVELIRNDTSDCGWIDVELVIFIHKYDIKVDKQLYQFHYPSKVKL